MMTTDLDALDLLPLRDGDRPARDHDPRAVPLGPPTQNPPPLHLPLIPARPLPPRL